MTTDDTQSTGRQPPGRARRWAIRSAFVTVALTLAGLMPLPLVVLSPGPTEDVSKAFSIEGVDTTPINGRYLSTSVWVGPSNLFGVLYAVFDPDQEVYPMGEEIYVDPDTLVAEGLTDFRLSQELAAAAAARAVGLPVTVSGTGARVTWVDDFGPSADTLRAGDVIVGAGGRPVALSSDVADVVARTPSGSAVRLTVERGRERVTVEAVPETYPGDPEDLPRLGVEVETRALNIELPFEITFRRTSEDLGPSAGLAYALAIADALDQQDLAAGRTIAATGEIGQAGAVGLIGGVRGKAASVKEAGAVLFLVPEVLTGDAARAGLDVRGASALDDALAVLRDAGGRT